MTRTRFAFLDWLRGWAMIVMIEVHVFNSMLHPQLKLTGWFTILDFINGLVAPTFLFVSGFTFIVSNQRKRDELLKFGAVFWKQLVRIATLFLIGYGLRLPSNDWHFLKYHATALHWQKFYAVDILQCIGCGLAGLLIVRLLCKRDTTLRAVLLITGCFFAVGAPLVWRANLSSLLPTSIAAYFNPSANSLFPIFPWLGFMFLGAFYAFAFNRAKEANTLSVWSSQLGRIGLIVTVSSYLLQLFASPLLKPLSLSTPNLFFFFVRLGIVLLLLWCAWQLADKINFLNRVVNIAGRESLLVYWLHIAVLYWKLFDKKNLVWIVNHAYNPWQCALVSLSLIVAMVIAALIWNWVKSLHQRAGLYVIGGILSVLAGYFFLHAG